MLKDNLKALRKNAGLTQHDFANKIGINRSTLADYEAGTCYPKHDRLKKIASFFGVTVDQLMGDIVGKSDISNELKILAITVDKTGKENIEFVPHAAQAGYLKGFDDPIFLKELPRFSIPKVSSGTYRAFEILGDSMPPITSGSIVVGQYIEKIADLKDRNRYVLITKEGIVFKRVVKKVKLLQLISDNINYPPYTIGYDDVLEAWSFHSFIGFSSDVDEMPDKVATIIEALNRIDSKIDFLVNH